MNGVAISKAVRNRRMLKTLRCDEAGERRVLIAPRYQDAHERLLTHRCRIQLRTTV